MLHRIRLAMQDDGGGGKLGGEVEVDETFIGGKARNMHAASASALGMTQGAARWSARSPSWACLERHATTAKSRVRTACRCRTRKRIDLQGAHREARRGRRDRLHRRAARPTTAWRRDYVHKVIDHAEMLRGRHRSTRTGWRTSGRC